MSSPGASDDPRLIPFLLKTSHSASWTYDVNARVLSWSKEHYQIYGLDAGVKPSTAAWSRCVHPGDRRGFLQALTASLEQAKGCGIEFRCLHRFRGIRWFRVMSQALEGQDRVIGVTQDITVLKAAEEVIREGNRGLERLAMEKNDKFKAEWLRSETQKRIDEGNSLAEVLANELRNPLAALKMAFFNLKKKVYTPFNFDQFAHIERKLEESSRVIQNMIMYFSLGMPQACPVEIPPLLKQACEESAASHRGVRAAVTSRLEDLGDIRIEGDAGQLKKMFCHILDNAFEAAQRKTCAIRISGAIHGNEVRIRISDNGCGIAREDIPRISLPFYTTKSRGAGLGLALCRQIASLHNGTMGISSRKGKGTAVIVRLPLAPFSSPSAGTGVRRRHAG